MIARLLLILGIFFFAWMGYRFLKKTWGERTNEIEKQGAESNKIQNIKACTFCQTHIPENEGIMQDENFFCSTEHMEQFLKQKSKPNPE